MTRQTMTTSKGKKSKTAASSNGGGNCINAFIALLRKDPDCMTVAEHLASRQRNTAATPFPQLQRAMNHELGKGEWTKARLLEVFEKYEATGVGILNNEDDTHPVFNWNFRFLTDDETGELGFVSEAVDVINTRGGRTAGLKKVAFPPAARPPRPSFPAYMRPTPPVTDNVRPMQEVAAPTPPSLPPAVSQPNATNAQPGIVVQIRGMEFELDLSKVPPELLKFRRML